MLYRLCRSLLFQLPPESAHRLSLQLAKCYYRPTRIKRLRERLGQKPVNCCGLTFPNPLGLAAGFDKNGDYLDALFGMGFGFIEVGAVTPKPQPGNSKPRVFRLVQDEALINAMGFNNLGVDYLVERLAKRQVPGIVGVNIGKNKTTPLAEAYQDYHICLEKVYPYADFITLNISSPNTPALRELQTQDYLQDLLTALKTLKQALALKHKREVPLLIKLAPDLTDREMATIIETILALDCIAGLILTNTTLRRPLPAEHVPAKAMGGLSGKPLFPLALEWVKKVSQLTEGRLPIIAVGGIASAQDAQLMLESGASLVQLYTGLIYQGPGLVKKIIQGLAQC